MSETDGAASGAAAESRLAFADTLLSEYIGEVGYPGNHNWRIEPDFFTGARACIASPPDLRAAIAAAAVKRLVTGADMRPEMPGVYALRALLPRLLQTIPPFRSSDIDLMLDTLSASDMTWTHWVPLGLIAEAIETWAGDRPLPNATRNRLRRLCEQGERRALGASERAGLDLLERLLGEPVARQLVDLSDAWGEAASAAMARIEPEYAHLWRRVIEHAATATASKPSAAWLKRARLLIEGLGRERFAKLVAEWLHLLQRTGSTEFWTDSHGRIHLGDIVSEHNGTIIKGMAWMCAEFEDRALVAVLADAAVACFTKVPAVGARCTKGGNACIVALGAMSGMDAVAQLVRLRQRVALSQARRLIDGALDAAAAREGLTRDDLEDLAVPTFDLTDGRLRRVVGSFCAELALGLGGRCAIAWFDAAGKPRKSVPTEVKRDYAGELNELKRLARDIETMLAGQRLRIERFLMVDREWGYSDWRQRLFDHPLLSALTRRLIWSFTEGGSTQLGCWLYGQLVGIDDVPLPAMSAETRARLFHPIHIDAQTTHAWQLWLERHRITQPFKQAHRELYRLTDAERVAELHSARFADHLLNQSQFAALCRQRGWSYTLQSPIFNVRSVPTLDLAAARLTVEFAVEAIDGPIYDEVYSSTGLSLYVMTGLVSFRRREGNTHLPARLDSIPPALFSEVMRDIDLFTGVSSVGVDPQWQGLGDGRYADYWQQISFGELSESARERHLLLERLLPALAIGPRCTLTDRALVVRGDIRTYRIHLGSGNILMQPNFDYLCIVKKPASTGEEIYLPFEGDATLSLILSKAMLLANDTAITDPTILRQIHP